mmetsp:Transcript_44297/g.32299  ORF Transcript_44297/g.32299 Transcript_44297/m.32299 type:complete len:165 (+) Transcript_44297:4966-5460(+)
MQKLASLGLLNDLLEYLQRNSTKAQLKASDKSFAPDFIELILSSIRIKALESQSHILKLEGLIAKVDKDKLVEFFESKGSMAENSFISLVKVCKSFNETAFKQQEHEGVQRVSFFANIKDDSDKVNAARGVLMVRPEELLEETNVNVLTELVRRSSILITNNAI